MTLMNRSGLCLVILALALVTLAGLLRCSPSARIDLTEDNLYTLSDGSKSIVDKVSEGAVLNFYFSDKASKELSHIRDYAQRVEELLQEYVLASPGNLTLQTIDPEPFSEAEDAAVAAGLQGIPANVGGDTIYFGLHIETASGNTETIAFFNPSREAFLEYDISQKLYRIGSNHNATIGVLSSVPILGGMHPQTGQRMSEWMVFEQLKQTAEVKRLPPDIKRIENSIDLLVLVHPQELSDTTLYAIDQYLLAGGKALLFVDPNAEMFAGNMMRMSVANGSNLPEFFKAWGVNFDAERVVTDSKLGLRMASGDNGLPLPNITVLGIGVENMATDDIITSDLETINVSSAGAIALTQNSPLTLTPLLQSSVTSTRESVDVVTAAKDHGELLQAFTADDQRYVIAARLSGVVSSIFPDGEPVTDNTDTQDDTLRGHNAESIDTASDSHSYTHLAQSQSPLNVLLVADTDILSDRLWVQVQSFFGQRMAVPWANNADFLLNAVEHYSGSPELISIRARGQYLRPFTVIEDLRQQAAQRFREQERRLRQQLDSLEQQIQAMSSDESGQAIIELTDEQRQTVVEFEAERLAVRKQLRQVQHQLNKDIEVLEQRLRWLNMLLVPMLLLVYVGVRSYLRRQRRRRVIQAAE